MVDLIDKEELILGILLFNSISLYFKDFSLYADVVALGGLIYFYMQLKSPEENAIQQLSAYKNNKEVPRMKIEQSDIKDIPKFNAGYNSEFKEPIEFNPMNENDIKYIQTEIHPTSEVVENLEDKETKKELSEVSNKNSKESINRENVVEEEKDIFTNFNEARKKWHKKPFLTQYLNQAISDTKLD